MFSGIYHLQQVPAEHQKLNYKLTKNFTNKKMKLKKCRDFHEFCQNFNFNCLFNKDLLLSTIIIFKL